MTTTANPTTDNSTPMGPRSFAASRRPVVAGLGMTDLGKVYGRSAADFAGEAVRLAAADAGLNVSDIDGLLTSAGVTNGIDLALQRNLGLKDLKVLSEMQAFGSTAGQMVQYASMAVASGTAEVIACVFADDPLKEKRGAGAAYASASPPSGWMGLLFASGVQGANPMYALAARRHMNTYGTTSEQLGAIAVAQREWAQLNPLAQMRTPMTLRGPPSLARHRRPVPPARLLPGFQRRHRGHRHQRRARRTPRSAAGPRPRLGAGASGRLPAPQRRLRPGLRRRASRSRSVRRWPG